MGNEAALPNGVLVKKRDPFKVLGKITGVKFCICSAAILAQETLRQHPGLGALIVSGQRRRFSRRRGLCCA